MAGYNIVAWHFRRQRHLGINAVVYSLAVAWEVKQTMHHFQKTAPCDTTTVTTTTTIAA